VDGEMMERVTSNWSIFIQLCNNVREAYGSHVS